MHGQWGGGCSLWEKGNGSGESNEEKCGTTVPEQKIKKRNILLSGVKESKVLH